MKKLLGMICAFIALYSAAQENGTNVYDESFVHEIRVTFETADFWSELGMHYDNYASTNIKTYMQAVVEIDGITVDSVGVRQKGFYSNWGATGNKKPLKLDFSEYVEGQLFDGVKKINLANGFQDPSLMRDALAYKFMRDAGIAAPRTAYAKVYLNDIYWGLYVMVEQIDKRFIKNWYEEDDGNLYKCVNNTQMLFQGSVQTAYEDEFALKTNKIEDNWSDFIEFVEKVNDDTNFEDSISSVLQMNNYLRILAADVLMLNWDSYYDHGRNFYVYHDSTAGAFQWIPWDYNLAFSSTEINIVLPTTFGESEKPLINNVMSSPGFKSMYFNHLCILNDNYFTLDNLEDYIDNTKALIEDALEEDPNKFFTTDQFNIGIENDLEFVEIWDGVEYITIMRGLKSFINDRNTAVNNQLASYSHACTSLSVDQDEKQRIEHSIYPNPSVTGFFTIEFGEEVEQVNVYTVFGTKVLTELVSDQNKMRLDLTQFSEGMYIVEIEGSSKKQMRIVKQ